MIPSPDALARAVSETGFLRRSAGAFAGSTGHKEWLHFAVHAKGVTVLVNFSVMDDVRPAAVRGSRMGNVTCLVHDGVFHGDVERYGPGDVRARAGAIDVTLGASSVTFRDGAFRVKASVKASTLAVELLLRPETFPTESANATFDDCPSMSWLVVPALRASGTLRIGDRAIEVRNAPAYHDHNWGSFRWGKNFAWDWGYGLPARPDDAFSLVFVRFMDWGRHADLMRGLLVWDGARQARLFRGEEVTVEYQGFLGCRAPFKVPRPMALLSPGSASDVPRRAIIRAERGRDRLDVVFEAETVAQLLTPNDDDLGVTTINEVIGHLHADGRIGGKRVSLDSPSTFEFLGG